MDRPVGIPWWHHIRDVVRKRIEDGVYGRDFLIVEMRLADEFETTRTTVRKALKELREAGLIATSPGIGTRVIYERPADDSEGQISNQTTVNDRPETTDQ